jgi:glycosyltransferase involved in cell wall biosynthesis
MKSECSISAIICTHNRVPYLRKALQSLVAQSMAPEQYEIIVVDNGSTDDTRQVVAGEFGHIRNLRYLYEPRLGLSTARNTGWKNAAGRHVAFMDDDAVACRDWLAQIIEAFETVKPPPGSVGGRTDLIWETPPPLWITEKMQMALAKVNWSATARWLRADEWLVGCNMAFAWDAIDRANGFSEALGRRGANLLSNEEILLIRKIETLGRRSYYQPDASVEHFVPASRLNPEWFLRRSYWQGVSEARMDAMLTRPAYVKGVLRGWRRARVQGLRLQNVFRLVRGHSSVSRLSENCATLRLLGKVIGCMKRRGT